jgi:dihydrodipicolinate synthase/N-acetylneuraminate lyase
MVIRQFVDTARLMADAGFSGIELHAAHYWHGAGCERLCEHAAAACDAEGLPAWVADLGYRWLDWA